MDTLGFRTWGVLIYTALPSFPKHTLGHRTVYMGLWLVDRIIITSPILQQCLATQGCTLKRAI
jgi:hypothetical protein